MTHEENKQEVMQLFDNHILKYIVSDLIKLNSIMADENGVGGCSIPQAISTFSALDFVGYLTHSQDMSVMSMSFSDLLKNENYFPSLKSYVNHSNFSKIFRDDYRSFMVHRYSMTKFNISKINVDELFLEENSNVIFNVFYFTKITIEAILKIYDEIIKDTFTINMNSNEQSIEKVKNRITNLKNYNEANFLAFDSLLPNTTITQTTSSLG